MPCTGTALCHPKIGYVDLSVSPLSTHKLPFHLWSKLMEITHTLPQITDTKLTVTSKVQFLQLQHLSSKMQKTQSFTRPTTQLLSQHLATPLFSNTNKPKLHESCSTKSKPYSMLQIKNFLCCVVKEKFRHSFVLPKKYSVREIDNFPKRYTSLTQAKLLEPSGCYCTVINCAGTENVFSCFSDVMAQFELVNHNFLN